MYEPSPFSGEATAGPAPSVQGNALAKIADAVARWTVHLSVLLIPLLYVPGTVDGLELSKQAGLIVLTVIAVVAWLGKMLVNRRVEFRRSIVNLLVGVYVVVYALSAWFSKNQYASFVGDFGQQKAGLVTVVCFALLYFTATNVLKGAKDVKTSLSLLMLGGLIAVVLSYLQSLGLRPFPGASAQAGSFNLIGTANAMGVFAGLMLVVVMGLLLESEKGKWMMVRQVLMGLLAVLSIVYVATLSFWSLWVAVIAAAVLITAYGLVKTEKVPKVTMLAVPMATIVIGALFIFIRFPLNIGLPAEVMPSLRASWSISREALASSPLFGSGPGTFLYDYTQFRSKDLNATTFWSVQFDRSASRLLTLLATTGILGLAALLVLAAFIAGNVGYRLARGRDDWTLTLAVFAGWSMLLVGKALYSSNVTLELVFWMLTSYLVILGWNRWQEARFENSPRAALMSSFFFIVAIIFSIAGLYLEGQRYVAERHYAKGVTANLADENALNAAVGELARATQLNGQNDLYYRTLSQALALQANVAAQKTGGRPDEEAARRIVLLAANAVNAGKRAADLAPANVQNWSSLANLYRDLGPSTPGAAEAAEKAYQKAIELEPGNPIYPTELGKVYLTLADAAEQQAQAAKDAKEEVKAAVKKTVDDLLVKAVENFDKAVELKADYAPAHYWIAVVLQRQGKIGEALAKLESVRNYNPRDLGVGFQLAILYYQNNQKDKAITELERIIGLSPQYSNARWYLAAMYEEDGKLDQAVAQIEEILKYNKDDENVKKRLQDLKDKLAAGKAPKTEGLPEPVETPPGGQVIKP